MGVKLISLRYPGKCSACQLGVDRGAKAWHDAESKTIQCLSCRPEETSVDEVCGVEPSPLVADATIVPQTETVPGAQSDAETPAFDAGLGGAAARREYERRKAKDDAKLAERHAFWRAANRFFYPDGKQTTHAWKVGAIGEERLARTLGDLMDAGVGFPLHDRRVPGTRGNIDHLFVGPAGVYVIDAKHFKDAEVSVERIGGLFSPRKTLLKVNGRDRQKLLDGVLHQAEAVKRAMREEWSATSVIPVLCFVDALIPMRQSNRLAQGVRLATLKGIGALVSEEGPLTVDSRFELAKDLHAHFRPMS